MELRPGYKQTEVGVIPEDWEVKSLNELTTTVASGRSKVTSAYGSYAVHGSTGIIGFSENVEYEGNAILVARVGANAGKLNIVSGKYGVTDNTIILRLRSDAYLPFFWMQLESKRLNSLVFGSGQPLITGSQLKALAVSVPPLPEQHAIASVLSDVDVLLAKLDQLITKKRDLKQAAMQQLLTGRTRLPGFNSNFKYKKTAVAVIPEDWDIQKISYLLEDKSILEHLDGNHGELYPRSSEFKQNGVPYIGANDFVNSLVSFDNCKFLSKERASKFKKGIAKDGDVLFAHNATVGPVALLRTSEPFVILSTTATYFRCNEEKLHYHFLKFALQSSYFIKQYQAVMAQSTRFQVPITTQRKLSLVTPPLNEQRAIATILSDMDTEITALEIRRDKTRYLKQGMMQELLTGKIRLL
ncbi:MAG: restriction endonuclease subunit S [Methylococcaceae bacterium]